jgi:phospholipid/cholesterol/gamma-HCH transport system ATP-binding protein
MPKIRIRGLSKAFGPKVVLDRLDLDVPAGSSLVVIGGSGSGKSVLIEADAGTIEIDGRNVLAMRRAEREAVNEHVGMLFQGAALFDSLPVWENVCFGLIAKRRIARSAAKPRAVEILAQVGLGPEVAELSPSELSGGMQKRVALARAIAAQPDIVFFDEPTTGLDPIMGAIIDDLIVAQVRRLGATAFSITHDMASAQRIADTVAMIHKGSIVWTGPAAAIRDSGNPFVDQFVRGSTEGPISMEVRR